MNRNLILTISTFVIVAASLGQQKKGKEVTVSGEITDIQCYISGAMGKGSGAEHLQCATDCAKGGIPLALVEDKSGAIYMLGQTKTAMKGANEMLMEHISEKVKVSGRLYEKGGVKLILISKVSR